MKQPKYLSLFLAGTLVIGGFSPSFVAAEGNTETVEPVEQTETTDTTVPTEPEVTTPVETTPEVEADVTAPDAPVVSAVFHTSTSLTIKGEVGAKAEILISGKTYERIIRTNGEAIFTMSPQPVGRVIDVRLVDASGNVSETTTIVVAEDATARPKAPVIGKVDNSSRAIEVTGTARTRGYGHGRRQHVQRLVRCERELPSRHRAPKSGDGAHGTSEETERRDQRTREVDGRRGHGRTKQGAPHTSCHDSIERDRRNGWAARDGHRDDRRESVHGSGDVDREVRLTDPETTARKEDVARRP